MILLDDIEDNVRVRAFDPIGRESGLGEIVEIFAVLHPRDDQTVNLPSYIVDGDYSVVFCNPVLDLQQPAFGDAQTYGDGEFPADSGCVESWYVSLYHSLGLKTVQPSGNSPWSDVQPF